MTRPVIADLGYERVGALLRSLGPTFRGFAACDSWGDVVWTSHGPVDPEVSRCLRRLVEGVGNRAGSTANFARQPVGEGVQLLASPVCDRGNMPVAWICAWTDEDEAHSPEAKRVAETLPRTAEFLGEEYRLTDELSSAVTELADRYEELNLVFSIEREARVADPHAAVLHSMLESFTRHLRIDMALFMAPEYGAPVRARGTNRRIMNVDLMWVELQGRLWRFLAAAKKQFVLNDRDDPRRAYLLTNMPFKVLALPNGDCGSITSGILLLRHIDEPDFTNSEMSLAQVFLGQAMILLRNQALMAKMQRFTRQIASSLVEAVEAKDPYTRGHSERVEQITGGIGLECGLVESEVEDLLWGALLHDIGKIGIPDAILLKPGRLDEDEYTFIKTHPERSYEILRHIEQLGEPALAGARYHQERFDGSGYPFGLKGEEIPLPARIVSVADTYDAVTSSRSYRAAASHEKAMQIIRDVSGKQLDPEIVRIFCERVERETSWLGGIRPTAEESDG